MKSRIEILAEVTDCEINNINDLQRELTYETISPNEILEAMKIAMRQAFEEGRKQKRVAHEWEKEFVYSNFDEYFKKYPLVYKKVVANIEPDKKDDKKYIAMRIDQTNHKRAIRLLFKIMEDQIERWWD